MPRNTRRSPGEGTLTQRKDGRWQGALQVDGRRRTVYGATRQEAAQKLDVLKRQAASTGGLPNPAKRTLNDVLDAWLDAKRPIWKPITLDSYTKVCTHDIHPTLGRLPIGKVSPERISRLLAALQRQGKHRTALKVYRALSQALGLAVRWGWLAHNPCDRVDVPRYRPERKQVWTPKELRRFLGGTVDHPQYPLWLFLATTGCRLGEALALEWGDVDLGAGTLSITKSVQRVNGKWVTSEPKTAAGVRTIALPSEAVAALHRQVAWRLAHGAGSLVFAGEGGQPIHASTVEHAITRQCERLALPRITPHGFRHLHASLLLAEGLPLPEVSRRLGHATPAITAQVYAHTVRDDAPAVAAIERALGGG